MSPSGTANWIPAHSDDVERGANRASPPHRGTPAHGRRRHRGAWDGETVGELEARGPWVAAAYHQPEDDSNETRFHDGWLRTGDVGRMYPDGTLEIVDRTKDLVKSGGEWISSVELERALASHPAVGNRRWWRSPTSVGESARRRWWSSPRPVRRRPTSSRNSWRPRSPHGRSPTWSSSSTSCPRPGWERSTSGVSATRWCPNWSRNSRRLSRRSGTPPRPPGPASPSSRPSW
jgi:hypothetical protein